VTCGDRGRARFGSPRLGEPNAGEGRFGRPRRRLRAARPVPPGRRPTRRARSRSRHPPRRSRGRCCSGRSPRWARPGASRPTTCAAAASRASRPASAPASSRKPRGRPRSTASAPGVYFVALAAEGDRVTHRVVVLGPLIYWPDSSAASDPVVLPR
jgi:hypothetical protein